MDSCTQWSFSLYIYRNSFIYLYVAEEIQKSFYMSAVADLLLLLLLLLLLT